MLDNKYSCEACGRHVEAVKQISIKSLPDNLIFHLKRFEYAFDIGKRIKVNDWFQFPREIDLFPYTMGNIEMIDQGIKRPKEETEEIYELVGVLVHTGTAESGHYYSYIRDPRPRDAVPDPNVQWFEFNDSEVKPWRIEELDHWCFGGQEVVFDPNYFPEPPVKTYSAYMLFYRRRPKAVPKSPIAPEIQLPPARLKAEVQRYNDYFIRKYVIYGEDLSAFVAKLLRSMPQNETSRLEECEIQALEDHINDLYPLALGLQVYRLVVSRMDFRSSVEKFCAALKSAIHSSPAARHYFYTWLRKTPGCLKELLLTNINEKARSQSAHIIATALTGDNVAKPRSHDPENGVDILDIEAVKDVIGDLDGLIFSAGDNWRSWSEYFETLSLIARDPDWARFMIEGNTIAEVTYHFMHSAMPRNIQAPTGFGRLKYPDNDRVRPNYKKLINLVAQLLPHVMIPPTNQHDDRNFDTLEEVGWITDEEFEYIFYEYDTEYPLSTRRSSLNVFVHRLFETSCDVADVTIILRWMLQESITREGMGGQKASIINALYRQSDPTCLNTADVLDVVGRLINETDEDEYSGIWHSTLVSIVRRIANWSEYLRETFYSQEHLSFWKMLYDCGDDAFKSIVIAHLPNIASQLIYANEGSTRDRVVDWLQSVIPKFLEDEEIETAVIACICSLYMRLVSQTHAFLERKFIITERVTSVLAVVNPVLQILRLIAASFPMVTDNADPMIEGTIFH
jgi:ubiquitin carboxyl-terminal hydrolase 34